MVQADVSMRVVNANERAGLARPADLRLFNCGIVLTTLEQG